MIQLSLQGKMMYEMLNQIVMMLLLYAVGFLLTALHQLPAPPLAHILTESSISAFTAALLKLVILSGFVTAGIAMQPKLPATALIRLRRAWTALIIAAALLSPFKTSLMLDTATAILLLAVLGLSRAARRQSAFLRVWQIGILLIAISLPAEHWAAPNWAGVISRFRIHAAYGVCGISVFFWLMTRWSRAPIEWAQDGVRIAAVLVALAGSLISIAPFGMPPLIAAIATALIPLCYMILAGHSYRALSERTANASLSPHWTALAALYWLIGGGLLGALGIHLRMPAGHLADAQQGLITWVMLAIVLAFVNVSATELRGDNRRVTGYVPFWLVAFGVGSATVLQVCRGVVEIYLRDVFALEAAAAAGLMLPLTLIWIICLLAVAAGILIYALGFCVRRPKIHAVES